MKFPTVLVFLALFVVNLSAQNYYINILNALIRSNLGKINDDIRGGIPNTYGACGQNNPPQPCLCAPCMLPHYYYLIALFYCILPLLLFYQFLSCSLCSVWISVLRAPEERIQGDGSMAERLGND
jgi:hypothetical protein